MRRLALAALLLALLPAQASMRVQRPYGLTAAAASGVAFDAASESHTGTGTTTAGSESETSFQWTHTPVGTPKGAVVLVFDQHPDDEVSTVTYGGTTMTEVATAQDGTTSIEGGNCTLFFLGSSVPTGAQTVVVNRTNSANEMYAVAITVTAQADTEVYATSITKLQGNGTLAEQSVTDNSPGTASLRIAGLHWGDGVELTDGTHGVGANSTYVASIGFTSSNNSFNVVRETTTGQGSRSVGFDCTSGCGATSDDRAALHFAVRVP